MAAPSRRFLWSIAFAALLFVPLVPALRAQTRPGRPGRGGGRGAGQGLPAPPATSSASSPIVSFHATSGSWLWLQTEGAEASLFAGGPSASPRLIARGAGWREVAPSRDGGWVLSWNAGKGSLLRFTGSGAPEPVLPIGNASGLMVEGDDVYWLEEAAAPTPAFGWIVPAAAGCSVRCRSKEGTVRTLATLPGVTPEGGVVLGSAGGRLYVSLRRPACTEFYRVPITGGDAEWLAGEEGRQSAVLAHDTLYWTAPSEEGSPADSFRTVRRIAASGSVETLTDWLPTGGALWATSRGVELVADRRYRVPASFGPATPEEKTPYGPKSLDGDTVIRLDGPHAPSVVAPGQQSLRTQVNPEHGSIRPRASRLDERETPAC